MNYRQLGKSDLQVSEIGFGCMSLGDDDAANRALLHQALDHGINYFDTADLYQHSRNETTLGKAFKGMRAKVLLATKAGNQMRPDGSGWDWNPSKAYILQAVEESLKRLQTDYIDLYQLHGGTLDDPMDETIQAFETLQQQGKIRFYGISSIRPNVIREYVKHSSMVSVMMQYSLLDRRPEEEVLALLQEHQIGVLTRGTYAQGLLLGKPSKPYLGFGEAQVAKAASAIAAVAGTTGIAAEVAARFVLHHPAVTSAVLGIRNQAQLGEALQAAASAALTKAEIEQLATAVEAKTYEQHR
ncbi:aldo/keto reductase [Pontibacter beigongshangensis]|uniref:aldo/keto reductase n=1 Tax=Pontibacter beigongshangensis TaxID=2574733 RepID=UPI00164F8B8C|nr:aldo/keto reductase [Pontibacter beigongshangensis]